MADDKSSTYKARCENVIMALQKFGFDKQAVEHALAATSWDPLQALSDLATEQTLKIRHQMKPAHGALQKLLARCNPYHAAHPGTEDFDEFILSITSLGFPEQVVKDFMKANANIPHKCIKYMLEKETQKRWGQLMNPHRQGVNVLLPPADSQDILPPVQRLITIRSVREASPNEKLKLYENDPDGPPPSSRLGYAIQNIDELLSSTTEHQESLPSSTEQQESLPYPTEHQEPSTAEHQEPLTSTTEHREPLPSTTEHREQLSPTEHQEPHSSTTEHQEPLPSSTEHQEPLPSSTQQQEPLPSSTKHREPLSPTEHQEPQSSTTEHQEPLPSPTEHREPFMSTAKDQDPLSFPTEHLQQLPSTSEHQEPLPSTTEQQEPIPSTTEQQEPLPSTEQQEPLSSTEHQEPFTSTAKDQDPLSSPTKHQEQSPSSAKHLSIFHKALLCHGVWPHDNLKVYGDVIYSLAAMNSVYILRNSFWL